MDTNQPWKYFLPTPQEQARITKKRILTYWILVGGFLVFYFLTRKFDWLGSVELHTLMETVATLIAIAVGALALMKYYIQPSSMLLLLGAGFMGTAFLDGYHTIVSSEYFRSFMPSDIPSLIPWSWIASRTFLSALLCFNFILLLREKKEGLRWNVKPARLYFLIGLATLASFLFFALVPLPTGYFSDFFIHRPAEYIPGLLFLCGLITCSALGKWKSSSLYNWLVLGLLMNVIAQFFYMPYSHQLFDYQFDAAHLLKILSYLCFLTGLVLNTYEQFDLVQRDDTLQKTIRNTMVDGLFMIDSKGIIQTVNQSGLKIFGYTKEELIGNNVNMLMGQVDAPRHDGYILNFLQTGDPKIIGLPPREVIGKTKDGKTIDLELAVGTLRIGKNQFFIGTLRDVTEKKQMLRESFEELEHFAYVASHDLKGPLKGINTLASWIQKDLGDTLAGEPAENLKLLRERVKRMETLLEDILTYSRASRADIKPERVNLNIVMEELIDLLSIPEGFKVKVTNKLPTVMAPKGSFEQIFSNLINNAIKHHDRNRGTITISSKSAGDMWKISVADDGPGIVLKYQEKIFKMFQTLESRDDVEGSGLGLSIVKRLVTKQGGNIQVDSQGDQRGTIFSFTWNKIRYKPRKPRD